MITDPELYELEILLIEKYELFDFSKINFDIENKLVLLKEKDTGLKELIEFQFNDRFVFMNDETAISFDIFKILQLRYFRNNRTVPILHMSQC